MNRELWKDLIEGVGFLAIVGSLINESRLQSALRPLPLYGETGRAFWARHRDKFVDSYQQYVDKLLLEGFWD